MKYSAKIIAFIGAAAFCAQAPIRAAKAPSAGKKTFDAKCASCHGVDGKGKAAMAKIIKVDASALDLTSAETAKKSDEEAQKIVLEGKNKMPAYKGKISESLVSAMIAYVRSLKTPK